MASLLVLFLLLCDMIVTCSKGLILDYNHLYNFSINNTAELTLVFQAEPIAVFYPTTVSVTVISPNIKTPLMIVARQYNELVSWKLPESDEKTVLPVMNSSRTLCLDFGVWQRAFNPTITISTISNVSIRFRIRVDYTMDFFIGPSRRQHFYISPTQPRYFYYNFTQNTLGTSWLNDSNYDTVILEVSSNDTYCMTVGIQNFSCPVFDTDEDVTFRGLYETVMTKGGITILKDRFPHGFYIVFVGKLDGPDCDPYWNKTKPVQLLITPSISYNDYVRAICVTLAILMGFAIICLMAFTFCSLYKLRPRHMSSVTNDMCQTASPSADSDNNGGSATADYDILPDTNHIAVVLLKPQLYLSDLSRKHQRHLQFDSHLYLYNVLTVGIFYGLPAIQLVVNYQDVLNRSGQQDLCYYNFLCAHPLGQITDFNHVFSNCGYVIFGLLFVWMTFKRAMTHGDDVFDKLYGIPQHYGMFYAMGVALVIEGVLSACYHICPNQLNFQFDSSFMYVMAVLSMVKLYQNRHPDINAPAYSTFGVLAIAILCGLIGILEAGPVFWTLFTVSYIIGCVYLSAQIYYMGCWRIDRHLFQRVILTYRTEYVCTGWRGVILPMYKTRACLLAIGNVFNWLLAFVGVTKFNAHFPQFLLIVFLLNTVLYFVFYVVMKYRNRETVNITTWICLMISLLCAVGALYFFLQKHISWKETPAQSRRLNQRCILLRFYDNHDIWHFLSATGMFFTFMALLTLDDDLSHTLRTEIPVF